MKNFCFIIIGLVIFLTSSTFAQDEFKNTLALNILNTTGTIGFIGTCSGKIKPDGRTLCSTPQKIEKGNNTIRVPPYPKSYPVFSSDGNNYFSCATLAQPKTQLFFTTQDIRANTLLMESFIPDSKGNPVAILCGLEPNS